MANPLITEYVWWHCCPTAVPLPPLEWNRRRIFGWFSQAVDAVLASVR